jgi:CHAT domain-containing protein
LFGDIQDLIKDKHLLIVPSGPLTALPFHVLVTAPPAAAIPSDVTGYANTPWLAKRNAITVLPSVSSLKALREFAKTSRASEPFLGFGNPLLVGPDGNDRSAWERQRCGAQSPMVKVASRSVRSLRFSNFFRSGLANVEEVRTQVPLPETADELCAVAESTGASTDKVYLGDKANETAIKGFSADGVLARARIVHFATHGLLAGETETLTTSKAEPALILTPPQTASELDDGLLTASEIALLKLDADWVVLSACNTAAGESDKPGAETLSGLARAFFYAGARTLLVSHWAVNSDATVKLVTRTFEELKADPQIGRAEALRRSMVALVEGGVRHAHPADWAPFIVVGEGGVHPMLVSAPLPRRAAVSIEMKTETQEILTADQRRALFSGTVALVIADEATYAQATANKHKDHLKRTIEFSLRRVVGGSIAAEIKDHPDRLVARAKQLINEEVSALGIVVDDVKLNMFWR